MSARPPSSGLAPEWLRWAQEISNALEKLERQNPQPSNSTFVTTNVTPDWTYDADSTSTAELADILGTLIQALKDNNSIK